MKNAKKWIVVHSCGNHNCTGPDNTFVVDTDGTLLGEKGGSVLLPYSEGLKHFATEYLKNCQHHPTH